LKEEIPEDLTHEVSCPENITPTIVHFLYDMAITKSGRNAFCGKCRNFVRAKISSWDIEYHKERGKYHLGDENRFEY
jgi:hypothetical protein